MFWLWARPQELDVWSSTEANLKSREQLEELHRVTQDHAKDIVRKLSELQSCYYFAFGAIQEESFIFNFYLRV